MFVMSPLNTLNKQKASPQTPTKSEEFCCVYEI